MAKKNPLSQQQTRRIRQKQQSALDSNNTEQSGLVISQYGQTLEIETSSAERRRCKQRKNLGALVPGDRIRFTGKDDDNSVIVAVEPRQSLLARPDNRGRAKAIAANLDRIFIITAIKPELNEGLIDRYLVAAEALGITPVIVLNKIDLADAEALQALQARMRVYEQLGYDIIYTSAKREHGLDALLDALRSHASILVGQSGVGKSSLVNALLPEVDAEVGEISDATGKGMHTTSASRLYHLPNGGDLIDSPGVREFGLWEVSPEELAQGFIEFRPYLGLCKFNDCEHESEPECAIKAALDEGKINRQRFDSYRRILASLAD
jgi:ribosome biogenesis GTPase